MAPSDEEYYEFEFRRINPVWRIDSSEKHLRDARAIPRKRPLLFEESVHNAIALLSTVRNTNDGYLPFQCVYLTCTDHTLTANMVFELLASVPDSEFLSSVNRKHLANLLLQTLSNSVMERYDMKRRALAGFVNDKIGRLWLFVEARDFYRDLLPTLVALRSRNAYDAKQSLVESVMLVIFMRISHDMRKDPKVLINHANCLDNAFNIAMDRGLYDVALPLSLFVSLRTVSSLCNDMNVSRHMDRTINLGRFRLAINMMVGVRGSNNAVQDFSKFYTKKVIDSLFGDTFKKSLTSMSLRTLIDRHGLPYVLQHSLDYNFPMDHLSMIHSYFYKLIWRYLVITRDYAQDDD